MILLSLFRSPLVLKVVFVTSPPLWPTTASAQAEFEAPMHAMSNTATATVHAAAREADGAWYRSTIENMDSKWSQKKRASLL